MRTNRTKKLVYSGALVALGIVLPQLFHIFGSEAGKMFLPMHIPVILAGLLVGPVYGVAVAVILPILSSMITSMPPVPMLYFMLFELITYAVVSGLLSDKINIYLNLLITIISGRLIYGLTLVLAVNVFSLNFPFANSAAFFGGILKGLPGIIIQIVFIPVIMYALRKGGLTFAKAGQSN